MNFKNDIIHILFVYNKDAKKTYNINHPILKSRTNLLKTVKSCSVFCYCHCDRVSDTSFLNPTIKNDNYVNPTVLKPSDSTRYRSHTAFYPSLTVTVIPNQHASFVNLKQHFTVNICLFFSFSHIYYINHKSIFK